MIFFPIKLRGYAQEIFELVEQGNLKDSQLMQREAEMMKEVKFLLMFYVLIDEFRFIEL
jgi:hypothetical protein